jgi:4-amino-4-deoxy-L-arabinose transferase-like glycosyltransferase
MLHVVLIVGLVVVVGGWLSLPWLFDIWDERDRKRFERDWNERFGYGAHRRRKQLERWNDKREFHRDSLESNEQRRR